MGTRSRKLRDYWASFLTDHNTLVSATGLPSAALHSEVRFRRLLGEGECQRGGYATGFAS
jgi:hypothetical protein